MSNRQVELYILDILVAIDKIGRYTARFSLGCDLLSDEMSWDATIRELEIIGEATKVLLQHKTVDETRYRRVVDFRNQINHGYFGIDEEIVWDVISNKLVEYKSDLILFIVNNKLQMTHTVEMFKKENCKQQQVLEFLEKFCLEIEAKQ